MLTCVGEGLMSMFLILKTHLFFCQGPHSGLSSANCQLANFPGSCNLSHNPSRFTKLLTTTSTALFLFLPTLAPQMKNTRQLYYFKTSQIAQVLDSSQLPCFSKPPLVPLRPYTVFSSCSKACRKAPSSLYVSLPPPFGTWESHLFSFTQQLASAFLIDMINNQLGNQHLPLLRNHS